MGAASFRSSPIPPSWEQPMIDWHGVQMASLSAFRWESLSCDLCSNAPHATSLKQGLSWAHIVFSALFPYPIMFLLHSSSPESTPSVNDFHRNTYCRLCFQCPWPKTLFFLKVARKRLFEELISEQRPEEDSFGKSTYVRQSKHPQSGENLARLRNKKVPVDQKEVFQVLFEG